MVLPLDDEKKSAESAGVRKPQNDKESRPCKGIVVAVGEDVKNDIKVGDLVYYNMYGPELFEIENVAYHVGDLNDFYCVVR